MLLSLTFYKKEDEKVYLQNDVVDHSVWKSIDFWKAASYLSIYEEIKAKLEIHQKLDKHQLDDY